MAHCNTFILAGFALALAFPNLSATAVPGNALPHYSGGAAGGLPSDRSGVLRFAQAVTPPDDQDTAEARRKLKQELDRIRGRAKEGATDATPQKPVKKKNAPKAGDGGTTAKPQPASHPVDPEVDRVLGQLLLMHFKGTQPSEAGPKAVHALLQAGLIAGAVFTTENIESKGQLKEIMKFFGSAAAPARPFLALREIGGGSDALPKIRDFEPWPSEKDVAAKGDPEYAYSTYRSMGANLALLGFNMNFGPALGVPESAHAMDSFGSNPLQAGVFAKTFILGHREANVIPVPTVDGSDLSVLALKTLIISHPETPIAADQSHRKTDRPFQVYDGLVRAARFCFTALAAEGEGAEGPRDFQEGCDVLILDGGSDNPLSARDKIAQKVAEAIGQGRLSMDALNASAKRVQALRTSLSTSSE
jgi:hypothetical protein